MRRIGALLAVLIVALAIAGTSVPSAPAAQALDIVSCTDVSGAVTIDPPLTALPDVPAVVTISGKATYSSCTGSGITSATAAYTGVLVGATCVPELNLMLGTVNAGTATYTWNGGTEPATTTASWTVPAAIQLDQNTSVIAVVGYSNAGRFHNLLTPAAVTFIASLCNPNLPCPGTDHLTLSGGLLEVVDVA